ncbi:hypothetical protein SAY86_009033 [Trapa natans]|uniref:Nucleoside phosphorylase domain-containing protein n=1 Tax=Trapa natans TaxID=22666 RepID=A0AAN7QF82_TRANT|nr:hypothetical protein SAY86_009033 [Trapa natans]
MAALHTMLGGSLVGFLFLLISGMNSGKAYGLAERESRSIARINKRGPYLGIVIPNTFEMNPLLQSPSFAPDPKLPQLDILGKRFRIGRIGDKNVILVMTGLSMLNAGVTTQLLLTLFRVEGVVHYGIAGNANPDLQIGDVTIPRYWAHGGLWNWQRFGDGPDDELPLESSGDYRREFGYLNISDYNIAGSRGKGKSKESNYLNNVWYQPEEIFPVNGVPEERQHAFWVPVDGNYLAVSKKLQGLKLGSCVNGTTCLPRPATVVAVERGISANIFVDNRAYREFLRSKFNVTPIDMETAAIALICLQQRTPFIALRSLSDLAGGSSASSNEASVFGSLAAQNAVDAVIRFVALLGS